MATKKSASRKASSVSTKRTSTAVPRKNVISQSDQEAFILARYNSLPYSNALSGPGASLSTAHLSNSVLSRIGSYIFGKRDTCHPRVFPYHVQGGQVQFFATDSPALRPFNISHGDRMLYGIGPMKGCTCSVVGLRAGRLWVVNDTKEDSNGTDDSKGRRSGGNTHTTVPIAVPLYGACEKDHIDEYMMSKVGTIELALTDIDSTISTIPEPVLNFLRHAPDLILQLHGAEGTDTKETCTTYMAPTYNPETKVAGWSGADLIMDFSVAGVKDINGVGVAAGCCSSKKPPLSNGDVNGNDDDNNNDDEGNDEENNNEENTVEEDEIDE
eukprot:Tbor_TRINITY_DN5489_c2_g1::TRINITY_DN5489_c2_g1_i2::g.24472::m.24472